MLRFFLVIYKRFLIAVFMIQEMQAIFFLHWQQFFCTYCFTCFQIFRVDYQQYLRYSSPINDTSNIPDLGIEFNSFLPNLLFFVKISSLSFQSNTKLIYANIVQLQLTLIKNQNLVFLFNFKPIILIIRMPIKPKISLEPITKKYLPKNSQFRPQKSKNKNIKKQSLAFNHKIINPIDNIHPIKTYQLKKSQNPFNNLNIKLYEEIRSRQIKAQTPLTSKPQQTKVKNKRSSLSKLTIPNRESTRKSSRNLLNAQNGLSQQQIFMRKQNYLNSCFNNRKNKLKEITHQNRKIYNRINSQKSLYSSRELNKSFQSNCSLSRRLSNSKMSHRSNQSVFSSRKPSLNVKPNKPKQKFAVQSIDVKKLLNPEVKKYLNIFQNKLNLGCLKPSKDVISQRNTINTDSKNKQNHRASLSKIVEQSKFKKIQTLGRIY